MPRALDHEEIAAVLAEAVPLRLASIDADGFPHVTPLWFEWDANCFWMTSLPQRPHVKRLRANPRASVCIDVEDEERVDGERPNRQARAIGNADVFEDRDGERTRRITRRYLFGPGLEPMLYKRASAPRVVIRLTPMRLVAVASL